jgi:oligoendopeptidase F
MSPTDESHLCWDLTPLYAGPDDPRWAATLERARARGRSFRHDFRGRIRSENLTAELLAAALRSYEELQKAGLKPYLYAQLLFAGDSAPDLHKALMASARETWSSLAEETLFFELELLDVDDERMAALLRDSEVTPYAHYLQQLRAHTIHPSESG